jgi:acetyl-CoA synthetase
MPDIHPVDTKVFPIRPEIAAKAHVNAARYREMVDHAARDPNSFWAEQGQRIAWMKAPTTIKNTDFAGNVSIKWFEDGTLNAAASCLDRHLATRGDQTAIIWESDDPSVSKHVTYRELHDQVCRLANVMIGLGAKRGDRVTIYLPMVVEAAVAMLACARIGAIHSVVFGVCGVWRLLAGQPIGYRIAARRC